MLSVQLLIVKNEHHVDNATAKNVHTHGVATVVMKNWEPLVLRPALAMESRPEVVCLCSKFSSIR